MIQDAQIEQIIAKVGVIDADTLKAAKAIAVTKQRPLVDILLEKNLLKPNQLGQLISNIYRCSFVDVTKENIDDKTLHILPELVAARQGAVVFGHDSQGIKVAMTDPENYELKKLLEKKTGEPVTVYYTLPSLLKDVLGRYRKNIQDEFEEIIKLNVARVQNAKPEDLSIIKIVDNLIAYAHHNAASDIHIEPRKKDVVVRFRIDGILHDVLTLPKEIDELVVARIKILSRLRIDEHRSSQDGKISMEIADVQVDIRVSILPTVHGEKVVMRLLSANNKEYTLEDLGFSARDLKLAEEAVAKPHGMILATGPTGCGKSTTLYALVQLINSREINISTIEDPVEYDMVGVNQIQVDPKTNLTFATGLRSLLRQDPDVIMVGEIRDEETAGIAVNSAMTGHLVLSSLHTNDAATALPRLIDMKIEPFLISSTVRVIIGQRLVRRLCTKCIVSYTLTEAEKKDVYSHEILKSELPTDMTQDIRVYKGAGCAHCNNSGFKGRIGLFELLVVDDPIRELIMQRTNADTLREMAVKQGMTTMLQDGFTKVMSGKTTIEEVLRATSE